MLDWVSYILLTCTVGLVTFGLIYLLFAEVFRSARRPEGRISGASDTSFDQVTKEERMGLTRLGGWRTLLSRASPPSQRKEPRGAPSAEDDKRAP